jgi:hypothetical protein
MLGPETTVNVTRALAFAPLASSAPTVNRYGPVLVGVPLIAPVEVFSVSPGGNELAPVTME